MNRRGAEAQRINEITEKVIGLCIEIHRQLGPGLLESAYSACLCLKLEQSGLRFRREVDLPVEFEGLKLNAGYRLDILVEDLVVLELKAVEKVLPIHEAQLLTYLKLANLPVGLLLNFNVPVMKNGVRRLVNNLVEASAPPRLRGESEVSAASEVKQLIPHREPFLFVDRIIEQDETRIITERQIRPDEPHFQGHYPGGPLMPGVLLCEACFQSGAMLLASGADILSAKVLRASSPHKNLSIEVRNRGRLPHWERNEGTYFVTWRLADSLPAEAKEQIAAERKDIVQTAEQLGRELSDSEKKRLELLHTEKIEALLNAGCGECYLKDDRCAKVVADALTHFDGKRYNLHAWCVMPNHVHVVFQARSGYTLKRIMHSWKSFTANECNKVLDRQGPFWMEESFDRLVRNEAEFEKFVRYTLENPVKAGLVGWKWVGSCGLEAHNTNADRMSAPRPVVTRILEAKFRGMVFPGDLMRIEVAHEEKMGDAYVMNGKVSVNGKNVLRTKFIVAMIEVTDRA